MDRRRPPPLRPPRGSRPCQRWRWCGRGGRGGRGRGRRGRARTRSPHTPRQDDSHDARPSQTRPAGHTSARGFAAIRSCWRLEIMRISPSDPPPLSLKIIRIRPLLAPSLIRPAPAPINSVCVCLLPKTKRLRRASRPLVHSCNHRDAGGGGALVRRGLAAGRRDSLPARRRVSKPE